jgi:hypothetical protein
METIFLKLVTPELINITKKRNVNKLISYGTFFDLKLVYSLAWIYKYYFDESFLLFFPRSVNIHESLSQFNELVGEEFPLTQEEISHCTLETIENISPVKVIIYGFGDLIFNELCILNKRRINTRLKALKCKIHILSYTSLKCLDLIAFDTFELNFRNNFPKFQFEYIDFLDSEPEIFNENIVSFSDFIAENKESSIYISMNIHVSKILLLEKLLKEREVNVSRKEKGADEPSGIVINLSKTTEKTFLKRHYDIYIFITQNFDYPLDILHYLKEIHGNSVVYIDSTKIKNINGCLKRITTDDFPERTVIKDSKEFDSYELLSKEVEDSIIVSDNYYNFEASETIQKLNLSNLTKKDYDLIRSYVKVRLTGKLDLEIKTCQMSAPCSPKDRSKKLNSLSNKISSYDYRCDVTCEIFKDYTIGVVVWNEMFANRKSLKVLKNQTFVHQTTSGKWKYTTVN